ncbi:MAG: biotin/lipoyl-binding protein [Armatimonadetes bacterium]|nr:biotin/lipoyl-binding protein [Candidatus Hippobium faecium]
MKNKKNKWPKIIWTAVIIIAVALCIFFFVGKNKKPPMHMETAKVEMGSIVNSVSADGVIEPVTNVEIKSNVGGTIVKLYADEGDYVKAGQLLAQIDPVDVLTTLEKEQNNVVSAKARLQSANDSLAIQKQQATSELNSAKENVKSAQIKLEIAKKEAKVQPSLTNHEIETAKANLAQAKSALTKMQKATNSQSYVSAKANYESAQAAFSSVEKTHERNKVLLQKGYLSQKDYEADEEAYLSAKARLAEAKHKFDTVNTELKQDIAVQKEKVKSAEIALKNAQTNSVK